MEGFSYDLTFSPETFNRAKTDERFWALLTLGRAVNALRFCQKAALDAKGIGGPSEARTWINSFLFASSVLYEGFRTLVNLRVCLESLDSYKNGFEELMKDKIVRSLRKSVLKKMRNNFVFHFSPEVAKESLKDFELDSYKLASGTGKASGEMYFGLADEVVMNYLLPVREEPETSQKDRYRKVVQETTDLMGRFTNIIEKIIGEIIDNMGLNPRIINSETEEVNPYFS